MYTEFISSEGLIGMEPKPTEAGYLNMSAQFGIQLFGVDIGNMVQSPAEIATHVNPDLIDINYGCPVKAVACRGAGAALLQDIPKMVKMTEEIVKATHLPVNGKSTRLGWDDSTKNVVEVAERLQDIGIKALTIHGRIRVQDV